MRHATSRLAPRLLLPACALLGFGAACASVTSPTTHTAIAGEVTHRDSVIVKVSNRSDRAITISLERAGVETRLGDVGAGTEARFPLRAAAVTKARIVLVATASTEHARSTVRTAPFTAERGQIVWFEVVPGLVGSRVYPLWAPR